MKRLRGIFLALLVLIPAVARADGVAAALAPRAGKTIDLGADPALKAQLVARGLVAKDATSVTVDAALLRQAMASDRFFNHVNELRYHVGDRILVEDDGSGGTYSNRAEITAINPDGTYQVKVWDKPEPLDHHDVGKVDPFTGKLLDPSADPTRAKVKTGRTTTTKTLAEPWLVRSNEREVTLTHDEIDALNGLVRPSGSGSYKVGRWTIDPSTDPVLADAIKRAKVFADEILPASKLQLPADPAARKAALADIAKLQEKLITKIYNDNVMSNPLRNDNAKRRLAELPLRRPDLVGKIGGVLESKAGICIEQAAALQAILEGIGDRGFTTRAMGGNTFKMDFSHGFLILRLADGTPYMLDPAWHGQGDRTAIDNLDFATYDEREHSNRRIGWVSQETTDETKFVDRSSKSAADLFRGYDTATGTGYLALQVRDQVRSSGSTPEAVARQILATRELEGNFTARAVAERARAASFASDTPGLLGGLDRADARNRADAR